MSHSANEYYDKFTDGISGIDLEKWENEITTAESQRMQDKSVMDILAAKQDSSSPSQDSADATDHHGPAAEWLQLAIDIEEKQYVVRTTLYATGPHI
jgi:hypothetical protein